MELSQQSIHDVIHPTAAFVGAIYAPSEPSPSNLEALSWEDSPLNPKNRIDSLDVPSNPLWKIDGCTAFGSQFYAVPLFLPSVPPMRIDFFIPEPAKLSAELRDLLDVDVIFHTRDASRIAHLGITRHILRILQYWSLQLATALLHLRESSGIFYPDLRLDNIVLSDSHDVVMVDFEQRGVWCEFAAPEVNAIEYIRLLAVDEEIAPEIKEKYVGLLTSLLPEWESMAEGEDYDWPSQGYNVPWACLSPAEQEACEVYMLGRVLWCIFEANSAPQRAAVWLSYRWEPRDEFPLYNRTPEPMRDLIYRCTRGRQPGLSRLIVRERNQLVLRQLENTGRSTPHQVQETARAWWADEIQASESFLAARAEGLRNNTWNGNYYNRPILREVRDAIEAFQQSAGLA